MYKLVTTIINCSISKIEGISWPWFLNPNLRKVFKFLKQKPEKSWDSDSELSLQ